MENNKEEPEEEEASSSTSWWGSFYDTAKKKLTETNEFMMRDITEFTQAVKDDASKLVASTAEQMKNQLNININLEEASEATKTVTNSLTDFLGKVVKQVSPQDPDSSDDDSFLLGTRSGVKMLNPSEARLYQLQTNPETYCTGPDNDQDYNEWTREFSLDDHKEEVSTIMLDFKEVRSIYTKLVPDAVSHADFWTRYFYKKSLLEKAEERRAKLVERVASTSADQLSWDDDDDDDVIEETNNVTTPSSPAPAAVATSNDEKPTTTSTTPPDVPTSSETPDEPTLSETPEEPTLSETPGEPTLSETPDEPTSVSTAQPDLKEEHPAEVDEEKPVVVSTDDDVSTIEQTSSEVTEVITEVQQTSPLIPPPQPSQSDSSCVIVDDKEAASETNTAASLSSKEASSCEMIELKTPKDSSSGDSSDWEKEFDIEMSEEEIQKALRQNQTTNDELNDATVIEDDWEGWE